MAIEILVLAAGLGKRMRSSLPKVLHPLAGRPLLAHVLDTARELAPRKIIVVHGHGADQVKESLAGKDIEWALQAEQLGTAHAVMQAMPRVSADADVLLLYGDVPLVRAATLRRLLEAARDGLAVLTAELDDPAAYGRVVRDASGQVKRIVEQRDASAAERAYPRDQRRLLRAERAAPVGMAEEDRQPQRAEGVLPHRSRRSRGRRGRAGGRGQGRGCVGGGRGQLEARAGGAGAAIPEDACRGAARCGRDARRPGAHRCARHARLRARRGDRRQLRVRGPREARRRRADRSELRVAEYHHGGETRRSWRSASWRIPRSASAAVSVRLRGCVRGPSSRRKCTSATSSR